MALGHVSVIIPAHNEEDWIMPVLIAANQAKKEGLVHDVIVADDGSIDGTAKIAGDAGAKVVSIAHGGKGIAFLAGLKKAKEYGAETIVMLDADIKLEPRHIRFMLEELEKPLEGGRQCEMAIYPVDEYGGGKPTCDDISGVRAMRMKKLSFLVDHPQSVPAKRFREIASGWGLEPQLAILFGGFTGNLSFRYVDFSKMPLYSRRVPLARAPHQFHDIFEAIKKLSARRETAFEKWRNRKSRH